MKAYEFLDHTVDAGLRIYGETLEDFFTNGSLGLYDLMTDVSKVRSKFERKTAPTYRGRSNHRCRLRAENLQALYFDWLRELLFLFASRQMIFVKFLFHKLDETELDVECWGDVFDPRHDGRQRLESAARAAAEDAGEGRLARAGRAPEN